MQLKHFAIAASAVAVMGLASCTTPTTITDTWRDPGYSGSMKKIFVHGAGMTDTTRRGFEDKFVSALSARGIQGIQAYRIYPGKNPEREEVRRYLVSERFDGALVATMRGENTTVTVMPYYDFYSYYGGGWGGDYVQTDRYVKVETSLWDPNSGKLVWSAVTQTENPSSVSDAATSVVDKIMSALTDSKLVPAGPSVARR